LIPELDGAIDVDFAFTPATNTLPLRRLGLTVGEHADIDVARVAFPERSIGVARQRYERLSENTYRYSSGDVAVTLTVSEEGLVVDYPGIWCRA